MESNRKGSSPRLLLFLIGLRWTTLLAGCLFLSLKVSWQPNGSLESLLLQQSSIFILGLFVYEFAASLLQSRAETGSGVGFLLVAADIICGILLAYGFGSPFFLLGTLVPILEAFLVFESGGVFVLVIDLVGTSAFVVREQINLLGNPAFNPQLAGILLGGESLLAVLIFWLFLLARKQEYEVERWQKKGTEEKKVLQQELETAQREMEKLYRDLLTTQKDLESIKARSQASLESEREEADEKIHDAFRREDEAVRRHNELIHELEESRKERENLNFLVETSGQMHRSLHIEETLVTVVETLDKVLPSQTCLIFLLEEEGGKKNLYAEVASSPYADYFRNYHLELGEGVVGWVARENEPAVIENGSLRTADGSEFATLLSNEKSAIVAPMTKKDGTSLGVIYLGQPGARAYSWQDVNVLLRFIPHIQTAIAKSKEYHEAVAQGIADPLTGLYNRVYFEERLSEEVKRAYRYQLTLSLIFLEIDRYQNLMASLDEAAARQVVVEVAEMLRGYVRDVDVLARIGEGRFAILLVQAERSNAVLIAERIRLAVEMRAFGERVKQRVHLTASIGVAGYPKDAIYKSDLMARCEAGLLEAIAKGGNKTCMAA